MLKTIKRTALMGILSTSLWSAAPAALQGPVETPLDKLCLSKSIAEIDTAIALGANVNGKSVWRNPLAWIAACGNVELARHLVARGARIDGADLGEYEPTPLCMAVIYGHSDMARFLLERGANPRNVETIQISYAISHPGSTFFTFGFLGLARESAIQTAVEWDKHDVIALMRGRGVTIPAKRPSDR